MLHMTTEPRVVTVVVEKVSFKIWSNLICRFDSFEVVSKIIDMFLITYLLAYKMSELILWWHARNLNK